MLDHSEDPTPLGSKESGVESVVKASDVRGDTGQVPPANPPADKMAMFVKIAQDRNH